MKASHKIKIAILAIAVAFFSLSPAVLAKSWPSKAIEDASKSWNISFSQPVDANSVTNANVYIQEGSKKIPVTVAPTNGNKTINVKPVKPYELNKEYQLIVGSALKSKKGKPLNEPVSMKFYLVADQSTALQSVSHSASAGFTNFTVIARPDVYSVKINTTDMQMSGTNKYSQGFYGLKSGDTVTLRAYSNTGKILETKSYTID